jgi:hypothetical protein
LPPAPTAPGASPDRARHRLTGTAGAIERLPSPSPPPSGVPTAPSEGPPPAPGGRHESGLLTSLLQAAAKPTTDGGRHWPTGDGPLTPTTGRPDTSCGSGCSISSANRYCHPQEPPSSACSAGGVQRRHCPCWDNEYGGPTGAGCLAGPLKVQSSPPGLRRLSRPSGRHCWQDRHRHWPPPSSQPPRPLSRWPPPGPWPGKRPR